MIPFLILAYSAKKGYDGYQKHSEAEEIIKSAETRYKRKKSAYDDQEKETAFAFDLLNKKELEISSSISEFKTLADGLLKKLNIDRTDRLRVQNFTHNLQRIENYERSAIAGMGMLGSLSAAMISPVSIIVLAIAGWVYDSRGNEALQNAHKFDKEVNNAIEKLIKARQRLEETADYAQKIKRGLNSILGQFQQYLDDLRGINSFIEDIKGRNVDIDTELEKFGDAIFRIIENGYALMAIQVDIITTPIFKPVKINDEVIYSEDGVPEMEKDTDGSLIINDTALDAALQKGTAEAEIITKT